jgi:HAD superfamily phosphatase (TIGR01668 family)
MWKLIRPERIYQTIFDIPLEELYRGGIYGMIFDLDNTLTEWRNKELSQKTVDWLHQAIELGIQICFVSNNSQHRVREIADQAGVPYVAKAQKPRRHSFRRAMEIMGLSPDETAVVGDQLFTDMLGGNRMGMHTVLVKPISKVEFFGTRFVRFIESFFLKKMR